MHSSVIEIRNQGHKTFPRVNGKEKVFPSWKPVFTAFEEQTEPNHRLAILVDELQTILLSPVHIENLGNTIDKVHFNWKNKYSLRKFKSLESWLIPYGNGVYIDMRSGKETNLLILIG